MPRMEAGRGDAGLGVLPTVDVATIVVASVAGIAGVLAFETRSSVAVGVAIPITTIPVAASIGAAVAVGDPVGLRGALAGAGANVGLILLTGSVTLALQRRRGAGRVHWSTRSWTRSRHHRREESVTYRELGDAAWC